MKSSRCSDEIFGVPTQMKLNPPYFSPRSGISSRSDFIHRRWIYPVRKDGFSWKKPSRNSTWLFSWQGHKGSNSGHAVLETAALPTELYPYTTSRIIPHKKQKCNRFFKKIKIFLLYFLLPCFSPWKFCFAICFQALFIAFFFVCLYRRKREVLPDFNNVSHASVK